MAGAVWEDEKSVIVLESDGDDDDVMITEVSGASLLIQPDDDVVFLRKSRRKRLDPDTSTSSFGSTEGHYATSTTDLSADSFDKQKSSLVSSQDGFSDKSDLSVDCQMWPKLDGFPFSSPIKSESAIDLGENSLTSLLINACGSGDHAEQECKRGLTSDLSLIGSVDSTSTAQARAVCRTDEGGDRSLSEDSLLSLGDGVDSGIKMDESPMKLTPVLPLGTDLNKSKLVSPFSLNPILLKSDSSFSVKDESEMDTILNHGQSSPLCLSRTPIKASPSLLRLKEESNNNDNISIKSPESCSQSVDSDSSDESLLRFDFGPIAVKPNNGKYISNRQGSSATDTDSYTSESDSESDSLPPSTKFGVDIRASSEPGCTASNLDQSQGAMKQNSDASPVSKPITSLATESGTGTRRSEAQSGSGSGPESSSSRRFSLLSNPSCKIDQSKDNANSGNSANVWKPYLPDSTSVLPDSTSVLPDSTSVLPDSTSVLPSSDESDSDDSLPEYTYKRVQKHFFKPIKTLSHRAPKVKLHNPTPVKATMLPDLVDPKTNAESSKLTLSPLRSDCDDIQILPEPHNIKKHVSNNQKRAIKSIRRGRADSGSRASKSNDCSMSGNSAFVGLEKSDCDNNANSSRDKLGQSIGKGVDLRHHSISSDDSSDDDICFLGTVTRSNAGQPSKMSVSEASRSDTAAVKNTWASSADIPDRTSSNNTDHTLSSALSRISGTGRGTSNTDYSNDVTDSVNSSQTDSDLSPAGGNGGLKMLIKPKQGIASFLVESDSDSNSSTSSSSLSVTSSSCQPSTWKPSVAAYSASPSSQKPPCRFLEALLSNSVADNDISLNCRIPLKKRRRLATDESSSSSVGLAETVSQPQKPPTSQCIVCTGIVSEFDVCECSGGHLCCSSCLEVETKTLLTSLEKSSLKCPVITCDAQFRMGELRKFLPSFVVEIIETREQQKAEEQQSTSSNPAAAAASSEVPNDTGGLFPALPSNWEAMNSKEEYRLVWLNSNTDEYTAVTDMFHHTMRPPRAHIMSVRRLQNPILWQFFAVKQAQMQKEAEGSVREQHLFHGTRKSVVDSICKNNFDWRLCGTNGTAYGQGAYFARDAHYSHMYTDRPPMISGMTASNPVPRLAQTYISSSLIPSSYNALASLLKDDPVVQVCHTHSMFLVRVLVGVYCQGYHNLRKPPPLFSHFPFGRCYDSCVNNITDPNIYVIFDNSQCYPEYLIEYTNMPPPRLR